MTTTKLIECPRDAMQGLHDFVSTDAKARYINQLLKVGYNVIDFGSFVSPKAIPQMRDTAEVLSKLDLENTNTELLAIVANLRGAIDAACHTEIDYLGYPFSISETFQMRNTNSTIAESLERVKQIQEVCAGNDKKLVIYISMGFGNPYGDQWNVEIVQQWVDHLSAMDIKIMALSDTIGVATPESIEYLFGNLIPPYPDVEFGAHLHSDPNTCYEKIHSAYEAGCRRFDGAIKGFGGCPMASNQLVGNIATENLISYLDAHKISHDVNLLNFKKCCNESLEIFDKFH